MADRRLSRRSLLAGISGLGMVRAVGAQTPEASPVARIRIPRLRIGVSMYPDTVTPAAATSMDAMWLSSLVYDAPLRWNVAGEVIAGLFSTTAASKSSSIELYPRTGAFFADGSSITAYHIAEAMHARQQSSQSWRLQNVATITAEDDALLRIAMEQSDASLLTSLAHPVFGLDAHGAGSGPFIQHAANSRSVIYKRNPIFWQVGRPHIEELELIHIADDVQRSTAAATGEIDILPNVPLLDVPLLQQEPTLYLVGGASNRLCHLQINLGVPVLADVKVRRILSAAINRSRLVSVATANQAEPTSTLFTPNVWSEDVDDVPGMSADEVRAELQLLGIPSDLRLHLLADNADATLANTAVILQEQLANCGISLSITLLEGEELAEAIAHGDYDLWVSYSEPWRDPHELVWPLLESSGPLNWSGYNSVEVDTLLRAAIALHDIAFRRARYTRLEGIIQRDVPCIPLFRPYVWDAVNARFPGYEKLPPATSRGLMTLLPTDTA